jgi:hypothetical protein
MKIAFSIQERRYLYGLMKLFAHRETTDTGKIFWADLANRLGPNQLEAHLRRKEVQLLLDIVETAVHTIDGPVKARAKDIGQEMRADILEKVLAGAKSKLAEKLADNPIEEEKKDGI